MGAVCGRPHAAEDEGERRSSKVGEKMAAVARRAPRTGATVTATAAPPAATDASAGAPPPSAQTVTEPAPAEFARAAAADDAAAAAAAARPVTPNRVDEPLTEEEVVEGLTEEEAVSGARRAPRARTPESHPLARDEKPKGASSSEEEEEEEEEAPAHGGSRFYELRPTVEDPTGTAASVRRGACLLRTRAGARVFHCCDASCVRVWAPHQQLPSPRARALAFALTRRNATACVRVCVRALRGASKT
jgi:hypothetical protein